MTLDDAINYYDGIAKEYRANADIERNDYMDLRDGAFEAEQLASWLNELKLLRERIEKQPEPCEDAVSRASMLETYSELYDVFDDSPGIIKELHKVHDKLRGLRSVTPKQQWIPCSERLPEKNGRYIVTRGLKACNSIWNRVYIVNYSDLMGLKAEKIWWDGNVGKSDFQRVDDVLAWMPLPGPYREEGEQE